MSDGQITLPVVGKVAVGGLNLAQAQLELEEAYKDILERPNVSVDLVEKATVEVTVIGEVNEPGVYSLPRYQNAVAHAIAQAGGLNEHAGEAVEVHGRIPLQSLTDGPIFNARPLPEARETEQIPPPDGVQLRHPEGSVLALNASHKAEEETTTRSASSRRGKHAQDTRTVSWQGPNSGDVELKGVLHIPFRGKLPTITMEDGTVLVRQQLRRDDITLEEGDVVVVPRKRHEVFFVVGPLDETRVVNFRVQERDRELGNAFLLPPDRDIDVVTAVAMAGYIDPIESPKTVTVHRTTDDGTPLLVKVDLIKARYDWDENIYVQPGDILYLNPDAGWWSRRTFDRIVPDILTIPYEQAMIRWINPRRNGQ